MDVNPAFLQCDSVRSAIMTGDLGAIVRAVRLANNMTLDDLAAQCHLSASSVSRMERGKQPVDNIPRLRIFAETLRIPYHVLGLADTPRRSVPPRPTAARVGRNLAPDEGTDPMRRRTLLAGLAGTAALSIPTHAAADPIKALEHELLGTATHSATPIPLAVLRRNVTTAWTVFQHGHYTDLAARLPHLLPTALATRAGMRTPEHTAAADAQLAELYRLTTELMIKLGHDHLAWPTADRALQTATTSDDPLTQACARRTYAIVLRRAGHSDTAQQLILNAAADLQPHLNHGPEHLSVYGALLATAGYTAAVDGDRHTAHTLISEAAATATRLGADANHRFTAFGPTGVGLYTISIAHALGDSGTAIETARKIRPAAIDLPERRARYWTDTARSFHQWNKLEECFRALLAAEQASPDEVRHRKPIQHITASLLRHPTATHLPGLAAFAQRTGTHAR